MTSTMKIIMMNHHGMNSSIRSVFTIFSIPETALKPVAGGKFEYIQEVPYVLHGVLNGFQGKNIKRIQTDCNVKVQLPHRNSKSDDVRIIGSRQGIDKASTQIELLVDGKRFNRPMTHFLTFRVKFTVKSK